VSLITRLGVRVAGALIGRRAGLNFVAGAGINISGVDSPANGRVDLTFTNTGAGGAGAAMPADATLAAPVAIGDASFSIAQAGASGLFKAGATLLIDEGTASVEVIRGTLLSGVSFAVNTPTGASTQTGPNGFLKAHSAGATIRWLRDDVITPKHLLGTDTSWDMPTQRALIAAARWELVYSNRDGSVSTATSLFASSMRFQDLIIVTSGTWSHTPYLDPNRSLTNPQYDHSTYALRSAREIYTFTATASNDRLTTGIAQGGHGLSIGAAIAFSNPDGVTFPGGITPGDTYYIKDFPTGNTMRLSKLANLSDTVNITSDGGGWCYTNWDSLMRWRGDFMWVEVYAPDVCGVHMTVQQPTSINRLRTKMNADSSGAMDRAPSLWITGQIAEFGDIQTDTYGRGTIGGVVTTVFMTFKGKWWIQMVENKPSGGLIIAGGQHKLGGGEIESVSAFGGQTGWCIKLVNDVYNLSLGDWAASSVTDPSICPLVDISAVNSGYRAGWLSGMSTIVRDAQRGFDLTYSNAGEGSGLSGIIQPYGNSLRPSIAPRGATMRSSVTPTYGDHYAVETVLGELTTANCTYQLLPVDGMDGRQIVFKRMSGAFNFVISPAAGEFINGSASALTTPGPVTLIANTYQGGWFSV
jgi:hypothetical protein